MHIDAIINAIKDLSERAVAESVDKGKVFKVSKKDNKADFKCIQELNSAELPAGTTVLFNRGEEYLGEVSPKSNTVYSAYGYGDTPMISGGADKSSSEDWEQIKPNLWCTTLDSYNEIKKESLLEKVVKFREIRSEDRNAITYDDNYITIDIKNPGVNKQDFRINTSRELNPNFSLEAGHVYELKIRAKVAKGSATIDVPTIYGDGAPYLSPIESTDRTSLELTEEIKTFKVKYFIKNDMNAKSGGHSPRLVFNLGGQIYNDVTIKINSITFSKVGNFYNISDDAGFLYLRNSKVLGAKKESINDIKEFGDFFSGSYEGRRVLCIKEDANPASKYKDVKIALKLQLFFAKNLSNVVVKDLGFMLTGGHGYKCDDCENMYLVDSTFRYIGGAYWRNPVRYGNAVEFWKGNKNCYVINNDIDQIYDAGITNQGSSTRDVPFYTQENIFVFGNKIKRAHYSLEIWGRNEPGGTRTTIRNVHYKYNTCYDSGFGWGAEFRPKDTYGAAVVFGDSEAIFDNCSVMENEFNVARDYIFRRKLLINFPDIDNIRVDYNRIIQSEGRYVGLVNAVYSVEAKDANKYIELTNTNHNSKFFTIKEVS